MFQKHHHLKPLSLFFGAKQGGGEMARWQDGEMARWRDGKMVR